MIQNIEDVTGEPVVGKQYWVPCVEAEYDYHGQTRWWPVLGPPHVDPELQFRQRHYHFDVRFIADRWLAIPRFYDAPTSQVGKRNEDAICAFLTQLQAATTNVFMAGYSRRQQRRKEVVTP